MENEQVKKPALASFSTSQYFERLRQQWQEDHLANKGFVWTVQVFGTSSVTVGGLASVEYTLDLNCSHVGETLYGAYTGTMSFKVDGNITGVKGLLALIGMSSQSDVSGWFKNDRFVMELKPFSPAAEEEFASPFETDSTLEAPAATGNQTQDAANQAAYQAINNMLSGIFKTTSQDNDASGKDNTFGRFPAALWYDWDFHMTEGDMGMFLKVNGGMPFWHAKGYSEVRASGEQLDADMTMHTVFGQSFAERYTEPIYNPFPYAIRVYPNNRVRFRLYNSKGGPLTVDWYGFIDKVPVENTLASE